MRDFDDHDVEWTGERTRDSDDVPVEVRRGGHREVYISRTVYRDGSPVTLEQVLVIEDDDEAADEEPPDDADPYVKELWWANLARADLRAISGRWRGHTKLHARKRYCVICRTELDVKPRGRPPKTCSAKCRKQLERRLDALSQNAPLSGETPRPPRRRRSSPTPKEPEPVCQCAKIRRSRVDGTCPRHGIEFRFVQPEPSGLKVIRRKLPPLQKAA